jgi:hypothetical protein
MRKIVLVSLLGLALGGCAQMQAIGTGVSLATTSITNPVTPTRMYEIESSIQIVMIGLQTYRKACVAGSADKNCHSNIAAIQPYTRQLPALLVHLRNFVNTNDQINAIVVYNELVTLYGNLRAAAVGLGVNVGA